MAEYIDRTALLDNLPDEPYKGVLRRVLMQAPVADVAPVVHSCWVEKKCTTGNYFECANCHKPDNKCTAVRGRYCWHCGAKMDRGD